MRRGSLTIGLALVIFGLSGRAFAQDVFPAWSVVADKAWWSTYPLPEAWPKAADALQAQLEARYKQAGAACFSDPDFRAWMDQLTWVRLGIACPDVIAAPEDRQAFVALGEDDAVSHLFVEKLVPGNVRATALQNILKLARANAADLHEYAALGVAFSLVFDEPFPDDWPHAQVSQTAVPIGDLDPVARFQFYVQANRDKKLDLDPTQLREEDLKYLVASEVKLSELSYAQSDSNHIPYEHFEQAFFSINYDDARVTPENQVFNWNFPTYTLADIEKHGGICVDQAYYASLLGKGRGIPTIYFHGQGTSGGHAWFGYLTRSGKWDLDCGRYASQNYPKGYALDPQTWQAVNDSTLQRLAKNGDADPRYASAQTALAWARLHAGTALYPQILEDARTLMPELAEPWQAEGDLIDRSAGATLADKKAFYQNWMKQFPSDADMRVEGQKRLLAALKAANDPDAESLQRDIVLQNRSSGFDLGVLGSLGGIEDKFRAQDWDGAKVAYETSVRDFKDQGGGTFFQNVVRPYAMLCLQYDRAAQAADGLHFTEERMPMESGSIIRIEFDELKEQVGWAKEAFPAAEKWLGELDQGDYEQAWSETAGSFQKLDDKEAFTTQLSVQRKLLGSTVSDRALSAPPQIGDHVTLRDGQALKGAFIDVTYRATFGANGTAREKLLLMKDDGAWRVLSYRLEK